MNCPDCGGELYSFHPGTEAPCKQCDALWEKLRIKSGRNVFYDEVMPGVFHQLEESAYALRRKRDGKKQMMKRDTTISIKLPRVVKELLDFEVGARTTTMFDIMRGALTLWMRDYAGKTWIFNADSGEHTLADSPGCEFYVRKKEEEDKK